MRVAITGSHGTIGTALAVALRARGDQVIPIVHTVPKTGEIGVDVANGQMDTSAFASFDETPIDGLVHLAGVPLRPRRWTDGYKRSVHDSRVSFGKVVAAFFAQRVTPPTVYLCGSAIGAYGERGEEELTEESPVGVGFLADLCREWERSAKPLVDAGCRVVSVRTGVVLTGKGGFLPIQARMFRAGLGATFGSGEQWLSWISLQDQISMMLWALDNPEVSGALNATAPFPVRAHTLTRALSRATRMPAFLRIPSVMLRLPLGKEAVNEMLCISQRVLPAKAQASGFQFSHEHIVPLLDEELSHRRR